MTFDLATLDTAKVAEEGAELRVAHPTTGEDLGIKMDNGFVAVGKPATCIDPSNWRDEIGMKISYDNTFDDLWRLEAYRKLSQSPSK